MPFSQETLDLLERAEEVEIETHAADGAVHRTTIWVVVDSGDVFVRTFRGPASRWYREALADPSVALRSGGQRIRARAVPAPDPDSITRASAQLASKYAADPSTPAMLRDEVLGTTLRLVPA